MMISMIDDFKNPSVSMVNTQICQRRVEYSLSLQALRMSYHLHGCPSKCDTLTKCLYNAGPLSLTLAQH